jgi:hypothetical protein
VTDGCLAITIGGLGNADRLAEDKDRNLALLHVYGARGLKAFSLAAGAAKSSVDISGVADPQAQGGASAVTSIKAQVAQVSTQAGAEGDLALSPSPGFGFSGAVALDDDGKFAGLALLKPVVVATTAATNAAPAAQAVLVSPDAVAAFLKANGVNAVGTSTDAKGSLVRVICVRK